MEDVVGGLNKNYRREKTTFYVRVWCEGVEGIVEVFKLTLPESKDNFLRMCLG